VTWARKIRSSLAAKVAICVIAGTAAFFSLFGYINMRMERAHSEQLVKQAANRVADLILRSTRYDMLHNNRDALTNSINDMGSQEGILRIRILNPDGQVTLASEQRKPQPGRVLTAVREIENSPSCSSASCHVHPASQRVLGVIDADLSLATVDAQISRRQMALTWFLVAAIVFGCSSGILFVWIAVYRPVRELMAGTHRVADGDLGYQLPVRSEDELGELAAAFNKMTAEVAGVQAHIEEQVRRKTAELERVHKTLLASEKMVSIGKLAATVAHEINNPLFAILTYARLVLRELLKHEIPTRNEMAEQLETIERESKRCGDLVKNLLAFSRQTPSHTEPNDFNVVVRRAILLVKHKLEMQNIELRERLVSDLPPIECDASQIQQVALILMVNASEAMPKGGKLEVSTAFDKNAEQNVLRVKDTGSGIPPDILSRIFDPFFTTKEDQNRTGLGLAVAHRIVEQHGGEISVQSVVGEGSEFAVALPVRAAVREPALAGASQHQ
jgi:two-component system NtrC family sensor kinase